MRAVRGLTLQKWQFFLVVLSCVAYLPYAFQRPGWVMDDYWTLRNAALSGSWAAAGVDQQRARPGAGVVYAVVFGWMRDSYWLAFVLLFVLAALSAVLLLRLLAHYVSLALAWPVAAVWVWLPNHTATEVWASAANIALSRTCLLAGFCLLLHPRRLVSGAAIVLLTIGVLCYEASLPLALAGAVALPWLKHRRFDWRLSGAALVPTGAAAVWMFLNFNPAKKPISGIADLTIAFPAHFGWGALGPGPLPALASTVTVAGAIVVLGRQAIPRYACYRLCSDRLVVAGLAVIGLGVAPFVKFAYEPLGAGDRLNYLSSMGGAMVWVGLLAIVARYRMVIVAALATLAIGTSATRWQHTGNWADSHDEAVAIMELAPQRYPAPSGPILVGPKPAIYDNTAAFANSAHAEAALQLVFGDASLQVIVIDGVADFEASAITQRIDLRELRTR